METLSKSLPSSKASARSRHGLELPPKPFQVPRKLLPKSIQIPRPRRGERGLKLPPNSYQTPWKLLPSPFQTPRPQHALGTASSYPQNHSKCFANSFQNPSKFQGLGGERGASNSPQIPTKFHGNSFQIPSKFQGLGTLSARPRTTPKTLPNSSQIPSKIHPNSKA